MTDIPGGKPLTGRKVLFITVSAFAIVIAVNVFMAVKAVGTFPGLEVSNSYVASQNFDRERAAQLALGWTVRHEYSPDGMLSLFIIDRQGLPAAVDTLKLAVGRQTHTRDDRPVDLTYFNGMYSAKLDLQPGAWYLHLEATAPDGTMFRQRYDMFVKG